MQIDCDGRSLHAFEAVGAVQPKGLMVFCAEEDLTTCLTVPRYNPLLTQRSPRLPAALVGRRLSITLNTRRLLRYAACPRILV